MEQSINFIAGVGAMLREVPEPGEGMLGRREWAPLCGSVLERLVGVLGKRRGQYRAAHETKRTYDTIERQLRNDQQANRKDARRQLANAKAAVVRADPAIRCTEDIAARWSNRLSAAIRARAAAERMRGMPLELALRQGAPQDGIEWLRAVNMRNLREASVLLIDSAVTLEFSWYSKDTAIADAHRRVGSLDLDGVEGSLGKPPRTAELTALMTAAQSRELAALEPTLPTASAILDRWKKGGSSSAELARIMGLCNAEEFVRSAEAHITRMRWRSAVIARLRSATRTMVAERSRALRASLSAQPA